MKKQQLITILALVIFAFLFALAADRVVLAQDAGEEIPPIEGKLSLSLETPRRPVELGEQFEITITVQNDSNALQENIQIKLPYTPGLRYLAGEGIPDSGAYEALINLADLSPGDSHQLVYTLQSLGAKPGAVAFEVTLKSVWQETTAASKNIPFKPAPPEKQGVGQDGGRAAFFNSRFQTDFPPGWLNKDAEIRFQLNELTPLPEQSSGLLFAFDIEAYDNNSEIITFDKPITMTIAIGDVVDLASRDESSFYVQTREKQNEPWQPIPVVVDAEAGTLSFQTTHFSSYQGGSEVTAWNPTYNPPGVSAYSGAATYSYPIALPPGQGGLTPSLAISYSSRGVDGARYPLSTSDLGLGWSMSTPQILNGNTARMYGYLNGSATGGHNFELTRFTLVMDGASYPLKPLGSSRHGEYLAVGDRTIKINLVADLTAPNVSGEYWLVKTGDGRTYRFGYQPDAEQVVAPLTTTTNYNSGQPRNGGMGKFAVYSWKLDTITDKLGRQARYLYTTQCSSTSDGSACWLYNLDDGSTKVSEVDVALQRIEYNYINGTATSVVELNQQAVGNWDMVRDRTRAMVTGHFRPSDITVKQDNVQTAKYAFTYDVYSQQLNGIGKSYGHWYLTAITPYGSSGSSTLPPVQFFYGTDINTTLSCGYSGPGTSGTKTCARLLERVENGYGAVTKFGYHPINDYTAAQPFNPNDASHNSGKSYFVDWMATWDGVDLVYEAGDAYKTYVDYNYSGADPCFDKGTEGCRTPEQDESFALVGFSQVQIDTRKAGSTSIDQQRLVFEVGNYWLNGKIKSNGKVTPGTNTYYTKEEQTWSITANYVIKLDRKDNYIEENGRVIHTKEIYTYDNTYGGLLKTEAYGPDNALRTCTDYTYNHDTTAWLINFKLSETVYAGACGGGTKVAEVLYRYGSLTGGSGNPTQTGLYSQGLLRWKLVWAGGGNYVTEKYEHDTTNLNRGYLKTTITYGSYSSSSAYASTERYRVAVNGYNNLGLPTGVSKSGTSVTTETSSMTYNSTFDWLPATTTTHQGVGYSYTYDVFGRLTDLKRTTGGTVTLHKYTYGAPYDPDGSGSIRKISYVDDELLSGNSTLAQKSRTYYNGLGQVVQQRVNNKGIQGSTNTVSFVHMAYDAMGRLVCQTVPQEANSLNFTDQTCTSPANTQTVYDTLGRVVQQIPASGSADATNYSYDVVTNITANGTSYLTMVKTTDANGIPIQRYSDAYGQLALVREMQSSSTTYADTRYTYDTLGNLTKVVTAAPSSGQPSTVLRETTMGYDVLGRKTSMNDADMGHWEYTYDALGNLTRQQDGKENYLCFGYDNFNRLTWKADNVSSATCPTSAPSTKLASYTYITATAGRGNLDKVSWGSDPANNYHSFTYDAVGRVTLETREINNRIYKLGYSGYDNLDRPGTRTFTYPNADTDVVTVGYDREGENSLTVGGTALVASVGYNVMGQMTKVDMSGTAPDTVFTYYPKADASGGQPGNSNFRLEQIQHGTNGDSWPDFTYEYDKVGNIKVLTNGTDIQSFDYDHLNRLINAGATGPAPYTNNTASSNYDYDLLGNITNLAGMSYGYDTVHKQAVIKLNGVQKFWYDANGNMTKRIEGSVTYDQGFDVENRLVSVTPVGGTATTFAYDASGQRVMTLEPAGKTTYFPFPGYSEEMVGTSVTARRVTYTIAGQAVASRVQTFSPTASNTLYRLYTDHLGSTITHSTMSGGTVAGANTYYLPYGSYRGTPPTQTLTDRDFTGQRENRELGLLYFNARFYVPSIGRFASADTIVPDPANPQSLNRYTYVRNSPLNFVDPSGHNEMWCNDQNENNGGAGCGSMIDFEGDWTNDEKLAVYSGAIKIKRAFERKGATFSSVYGETVKFRKTGIDAKNLGEATRENGQHVILVNNVKGVTAASDKAGSMWTAHELGHAFNNALSPNQTEPDYKHGQGLIDLAQEGVSVNGELISGAVDPNSWLGDYKVDFRGYQSKSTPYVQNQELTASEDFANMFSNYVHNSFAVDDFGQKRYDFMDNHMNNWLALAVSNNE